MERLIEIGQLKAVVDFDEGNALAANASDDLYCVEVYDCEDLVQYEQGIVGIEAAELKALELLEKAEDFYRIRPA